jgi:UDP-3-O-[3-hydroxymyristoyl] glucosamine N-acyltransferase
MFKDITNLYLQYHIFEYGGKTMKNCYVSDRARIGKNVLIGNNVAIYGDCHISDGCIIGDNISIGFPYDEEIELERLKNNSTDSQTIDMFSIKPTRIGTGVKILSNSVIYSGVKVNENTTIYEHSRIGDGTSIGKHCKIRYGAQIYTAVSIGDDCIVTGFCCSRAKIGSHSTMLGNLVHKYYTGWIDNLKEPAPKIDDHVIVGYNALIIGDIKISKYVYIAAGAIVTKSIPSKSVVVGNCKIYESNKWKGKLNLSDLFNLDRRNGNE